MFRIVLKISNISSNTLILQRLCNYFNNLISVNEKNIVIYTCIECTVTKACNFSHTKNSVELSVKCVSVVKILFTIKEFKIYCYLSFSTKLLNILINKCNFTY